MAENKNFFKVDGIVYAKPVKEVTSKKSEKFIIPTVVLEFKSSWEDKDGNNHDNSDLVEFNVSKNVASILDSYSIKDHITIGFRLAGKEFKSKNGIMYLNKPFCYAINHADLDSNRDTHRGKLTTTPEPTKNKVKAEVEDDDLPF